VTSGDLSRRTLPRAHSAESGDNARVIHRASRATIGVAAAVVLCAAVAPVVYAHGDVVPPEPTALSFLLGWTFDPTVWLPAIAALLLWRAGVGMADRAHPGHPVERRRTAFWVAGVAVVVIALDSGVGLYDTTLFGDHMLQHMLLTMIAPPLLLLAGPITLVLQASSAATRKRWILPFLHSRVVRFLSFPVVSWLLFAAVMWGTHFSPLFDASLENEWLHRLEHALYLSTALLFWWPVVGPDPSPWRMTPAVRPLYVGLQMTQNTFLAVAIYFAPAPLYRHYETLVRSWGPTPLEDQQLAGGLMWMGGDLVFLTAIFVLVAAWMRHEDRRAAGEDRRLAGERAAIREREVRLAARLAAEREPAGGAGTGGSAAGGA
jgi:cytochrome c oxidase assembly factor CtaG